ncbi:NADH-quinone oxidoreductase subunit L [Mycobacterium intracellulare]|uniref:proton-conducting transporter transmembrane domain-containing protein n=1 Tax=Mycobacterium intracellulare TaxID=1767 RepID=UPI001CD96A8B|nr:proton-conducting transporter membrane subunit [Mycobacterium intracellulare]MCA2306385.1 NADH-quinone oxidoreductase subunit L [Mycobacterium intracellulare]MCA2348733.1 NADH-quinone oxidoreductase subunit L [Mycobacterium intracellulare]
MLAPAVVGATLLLGRRMDRIAAAIGVTMSAVMLVLSIVVSVGRPKLAVVFMAGTDFALRVDALAATVLPAVAAVTLLVLLFAAGDIREAPGRFHGLMLLFAAAVVVTATAATLPTLLLAWEVMGAASYALIGFRWRDEHRMSAGLTAFLTTRTADLGLYLAAAAAVAGGAGLALADLPDASGGWRHVIAFGVLVAALGKAAQLPFSFWLSRAMEGPSAVSALLHSAAMVAMGAYLLLRTRPLLAATGWAAPAAAWMGAGTAVLLGAVAVAQRDLKQLLAASTAAQLGFVVMAAGLGAVGDGAAQLIAHAFTKAGLFLAAGAWLSVLGTKQLDDLWGVARRWRLLGWSATVGALALAGIAPLSLWATKDTVLAAALHYSPALYAAGLVASALSAAYAGKILVVLWRTKATGDSTGIPREALGPNGLQQAPIVILAVGAAAAGVLALPPIGAALTRALHDGPSPPATAFELVASAVLAIIVIVAVARWWVPEPRWAGAWLGLERAAHVFVVRPTFGLGRVLARFDDGVLDRLVEATATRSLRAAHRVAHIDIRAIDGAVEAVAGWMRRLGELARRPQTGLLHQYYLAAVVVLVFGVLLLVVVR